MANMPKPKSSAARFVLHTAGMRIILMSTSGDADRFSATTHRARNTTAAPNRGRIEELAHPHVGAKRDGEQGSACALNDPADQHHRQGGRQRTYQRPEREGNQDSDDDPLLADHVADSAEDRRGDSRAKQVGGQQPARRVLRSAQGVLQLRNGRNNQRLQQAVGHRGCGEDREGNGVIGVFSGQR